MFATCLTTLVAPLVVFVSTSGTPGGDGSARHPVGSISDALARVRSVPHTSARIVVGPGVYSVDAPIEIGLEDLSGPLSIGAANPGRKTVIEGGRAIEGWSVGPNGWWTVTLPEVASGKWYFSELFANGVRRFRPRWPRHGFSFIVDAVEPSPMAKGHGSDRFAFSGADVRSDWSDRDDVELVMFHNWSVTFGRIASVDGPVVRLKSPTCAPDSWAGLPKGNRYFADNVKDALGSPGDWYLDRGTGVLTYVPIPGETPKNTVLVAPVASSLLEVRGDSRSRRWASHSARFGADFSAYGLEYFGTRSELPSGRG